MVVVVNQKQVEPRTRHMGRGHVAALDGLRGLAVLGVMATHLLTGDLTQLPPIVGDLLSEGVAGVDLFFVLSGFLITGILRDSMADRHYFRKFYARRVLRIFPLYYGVVLLLIALTHPLEISWGGVQWSLLLYLQNTHLLVPSLVNFHNRFFSVDHLWSLAVEEQFYLVWPFVIAAVRPARRVFALCAATVLLSFLLRFYCLQLGYGYNWINRNTLCRADELVAGAALALLLRSRYAERVIALARPVLVGALTMGAVHRALGWWWHPRETEVGGAYLISAHYTWNLLVAAALIVCCLEPASRLRRVFERRYLRWLGKYSYGLYVLHLPLLSGITLLLLGPLREAMHSKVLARLVIAVLVFGLSCAAAYLSFHLYERRFLRLKRFFDYDRAPAAG